MASYAYDDLAFDFTVTWLVYQSTWGETPPYSIVSSEKPEGLQEHENLRLIRIPIYLSGIPLWHWDLFNPIQFHSIMTSTPESEPPAPRRLPFPKPPPPRFGDVNEDRLHQLVNEQTAKDVWILLIVFRCINALCVRTFFQPDEYFQSLEPAWQMAFGPQSGSWITWACASSPEYLPNSNSTIGMGASAPLFIASNLVCHLLLRGG